jgi:nuclear pore complex protein Nup93
MALDTINKCLSEAICALSRGRLDGESRTAGLIHSGNEILEMDKYSSEARFDIHYHLLFNYLFIYLFFVLMLGYFKFK